jgi:two-component system, OmpR family, sensor kinase
MATERPPKPPRLVVRVAWAGALSAALGGALASIVSGSTAWIWVERGEDRELLRVTQELADELEEELEEPEDDDSPEERRHFAEVHGPRTLANLLLHELEDVRLRDPRAAVREGNRIVAGDGALPDLPPGKCVNVALPEALRVCSSAFGGRRLTLAKSAAGEVERRRTFLGSVLLGAISAALLGGFGSLFVASWALGPFDDLRKKIRAVRPERPRPEELAAAAPYVELEELRQAVVELVERLASELTRAQSFASQAAHELRTPLAALHAEVELMVEARPELAELADVRKKLSDLTKLVERLLALATPGTDVHKTGRAVDLGDTLHDVLRDLGARAARVEARSMDDSLVRGDEQLLHSLLFNAIDNALKFSTDADDARVLVEVSLRGEHVVVKIEDHGIGMSEAERQRAFLAFYRSPAVRAAGIEGHGIGVALMRHVAQAHGGQLRYLPATSGTVLEVELPRFA